MARCEDFPCCGHTAGDPCPDVDSSGNTVMRCVECGKRLSRKATSSICAKCTRRMNERMYSGDDDFDHSMNG